MAALATAKKAIQRRSARFGFRAFQEQEAAWHRAAAERTLPGEGQLMLLLKDVRKTLG